MLLNENSSEANNMTKIALISDIHGNYTALKSVVNDIKLENISETWFLGDLLLPGPAGNALFEMLDEINTTVFLRGNWDDVFLKILDNPNNYDVNDPSDVYMGHLAYYLSQKLNAKYIEKIREAPIHLNKTVNNINLTLTHNEIDNNGGPNLLPFAATENFEYLFENDEIDVAIYAHTHHQLLRYTHNDQVVLNPGSVGEPFFKHPTLNQDRRAQYTILEIDDIGIQNITFRKVAYNLMDEYTKAKSEHVPYLDLYNRLLVHGISPTQDKKLLSEINAAGTYNDDFKRILASRTI